METPYLPLALFEEDFQNVYEPAEDTFLLLDALEKDLEELRANATVCLECGSGSGTVITALSKSLKETGQRLMIGTDINIEACKTTRKCANYHGQNNIQVLNTNLANCLTDRLENKVDVLIFNPPYVPTEQSETMTLANTSQINLSWAGGDDGRLLTDKFLSNYVPKLLSKPNGVVYLVAIEQNNINYLLNYPFKGHKISGSISVKRRAGSELLYVIKYKWVE